MTMNDDARHVGRMVPRLHLTYILQSKIICLFLYVDNMTEECQWDDDDLVLLSQQAFAVYCDQVVRDAVEKNEAVRAENASMEAARKMLTHMTIYKKNLNDVNESCEKVMEINLQTAVVVVDRQQNQQVSPSRHSHVLVYDVESHAVEFPLEDAPHLYCEIASVRLRDGIDIGVVAAQLAVKNDADDETVVELELHPIRDVKITGTLRNFSGTVQKVQQMIDSGEFSIAFMRIGHADPDTRQPFPETIGDSLSGAFCSLKKVEVAESCVHGIHTKKDDHFKNIHGLFAYKPDEEDKELLVLANATNNNHAGLCKAIIMDRPVLKTRNTLLKHSREIFQTLSALYPGTTLRFKMEQGSVGRMYGQTTAAGTGQPHEAAWVVSTSTENNTDQSTIMLSAMSQLRLFLANVYWFTCPLHVDMIGRGDDDMTAAANDDDDGLMILKYSNTIEAVFRFDESLNDVDVDSLPGGGGLHQYIRHALTLSPQQHQGGGHWQRHQQQGPQFTMRLVAFHIRLSVVRSHLEALGIEVNTDEE
jgi:hypothetical protein